MTLINIQRAHISFTWFYSRWRTWNTGKGIAFQLLLMLDFYILLAFSRAISLEKYHRIVKIAVLVSLDEKHCRYMRRIALASACKQHGWW